MHVLKSLAEAQAGQVVSFTYYGGSSPGSIRTVMVTDVRDDRIVGDDYDRKEPRQFLFERASLPKVIEEVPEAPIAAEAACDESAIITPSTRVRRTPMSFAQARQRLHEQIDALTGEDLAEALAEVDGEDRGTFDASNGQVILERDVPIPHAVLNMNAQPDAVGLDWVNEDGDRLTTVTRLDGDTVRLFVGESEVHAETFISDIAEHFGLTN